MLRVEAKEWKALAKKLERINAKGAGIAMRETVNEAAFRTMREGKQNVAAKLTLRNKWTEKSIRVEKTARSSSGRQFATVGSTEQYMYDQEFGAVRRSKGRQGVPIATGYAAGQEGQKPVTRLPRAPNTRRRIQLAGRKGKSRKQRNLLAVKENRGRYVFMDLGKRKGIFKVTGGKRNPKVKMVWDLTRRRVTVPASPWLGPAVDTVAPQMGGIFKDKLLFQFKRLGL